MLKEMIQLNDEHILKEFLDDIHAHDLAELFVELTDQEKNKVFSLLPNEKLAELVSYLEAEDAAEILTEFDLEKQVELVEMMEPDDAADIIIELDKEEKEELLDKLSDDSEIKELMQYDEDETGSVMTTLFIVVEPDLDVKKATKKVIKEADQVESINTIFVADEKNIYLGAVALRDLLKAKTPLEVKELIMEYPVSIDTDPINKTVQAIRNYGIYEMPVVDEYGKLLGMVTLDDALDVYQEEAQEDFEKLAALPETEEDSGPLKTAMHRIPWLITLLIVSLPIALITRQFEHVLTAVAILIVFQPLILGSAGNVATQTLAVTLQMLSTHEKGIIKNSAKEILTGIMNGFIIGLIAFVMTNIFALINTSLTTDPLLIGLVVGLSLWLTVIVAPILAILIPLALHTFKLDPAVASGPFITTLIDLTAQLIYFGLATLILGGLL
ncbi:MAG: magnesium transporter [Acholeplasmataceae bacterium]|jgi:magnesium transporter|nr:magnesium transporter [Acholeplasmataceae bacterium]